MLHHADDELIGANITNLQQETLGNIDALVVDLDSGKVTYAIVSFGGVLGVGDDLYAVPFNAFSYRPLYDGVVLDVNQAQLEQDEGFPREQMPDFADRQWGQTVYQRYGTQPHWEARSNQGEYGDQHDEWEQDRDQQPRRQQEAESDERTYPGMQPQQFVTTYDLIGMTVENSQGEEVGAVRDLAVDLRSGNVEHVVMGYGGWLGIGETNTAVPLQMFQPRNLGTDEPVMIIDITQDQLRGAPEYPLDEWPRRGAGSWAEGAGVQSNR